MDDAFLFDNQLISEVENLIRNSKTQLLLVSPFIDLDNRIKDALREKRGKANFKLRVLFGKNENNIYRSVKKDSMTFLKTFPNIEIRYNERLHAKFYLNDTHFIMTSMNLYDYSLSNNIEVGFIINYASKGVLGKFADTAGAIIEQSVSLVKSDIFGISSNEINPIEKFNLIFENSELKYKTKPILKEKKGVKGLVGLKEIKDKRITVDVLEEQSMQNNKKEVNKNIRCYSSSKIAERLDVNKKEIIKKAKEAGYVKNNVITGLGKSKGLKMKSYMGKNYIAFPEDLDIFKSIKIT